MSISPIIATDIAAAYEAFDELLPHMNDVRRLEGIELFDEDEYLRLGIKVVPILQSALDRVEVVLRNRGFFTEEFNTTIAEYKKSTEKTEELEQKIRDLRQESAFLMQQIQKEYDQTKVFVSLNVTASYLHISPDMFPEGGEDPPETLRRIELIKKISRAFDALVNAAVRGDDEGFIRSMEAFSNSYENVVKFHLKGPIPEYIKSLEKELEEVRANVGLPQ